MQKNRVDPQDRLVCLPFDQLSLLNFSPPTMAPPVATETPFHDAAPSLLSQKSEMQMNGGSKTNGATDYEVDENWEGKYRFAPIQEAQVSRAMIKRYVSHCLGMVVDSG